MNEIWPFAILWMDLEDIMLCEVSLTEKDKYHSISTRSVTRDKKEYFIMLKGTINQEDGINRNKEK